MSESRMPPSRPPTPTETDAELEAIPPPRHPWRRVTLGTMTVTAAVALALAASLARDAAFSVQVGEPRAVGNLASFQPSRPDSNEWVHGEGELLPQPAVAYRRPLESDSYRLAPVAGNSRLWVQLRVPADPDDPDHLRFVPPSSFVGRLLPAADAGLRFSQLPEAVAEAGAPALPRDAWLLIDGEAPATTRWTLGVILLLVGFALFNGVGLYRLARPVS